MIYRMSFILMLLRVECTSMVPVVRQEWASSLSWFGGNGPSTFGPCRGIVCGRTSSGHCTLPTTQTNKSTIRLRFQHHAVGRSRRVTPCTEICRKPQMFSALPPPPRSGRFPKTTHGLRLGRSTRKVGQSLTRMGLPSLDGLPCHWSE